MRVMVFGAAAFLLAACGSETPAPPADAPDVAAADDLPEPPAPAPGSCKDIEALVAASAEPTPFASLRGAPVAGASDAFTTTIAPAGARCQIGAIPADANMGAVHVVNCTLFSSGAAEREKNAEKAELAFDTARADLERCLPSDTWTHRDGSSTELDTSEAMIYETKADAQKALTARFYTYPIQLKREFVEDLSSGRTPGWYVTLDFQKEAAKQ